MEDRNEVRVPAGEPHWCEQSAEERADVRPVPDMIGALRELRERTGLRLSDPARPEAGWSA